MHHQNISLIPLMNVNELDLQDAVEQLHERWFLERKLAFVCLSVFASEEPSCMGMLNSTAL